MGAAVAVERRASTPGRIGSESYRIYLVLKYVCYFGIPAHAFYVVLFYSLHVPLLAWYNVASTVSWMVAAWLNRRGWQQRAIDLLTMEIVGFAAMGVYTLGWECGFQTLLMPLMAFVMLNHRLRAGMTVLEGIALVALYIGLYRLSLTHPITAIPHSVIESLHYANIGVVFATICIVSYFFREASLSAEKRMEVLATTDSLTRLANRTKMWDVLAQAQLRAEHDREPVVIALGDIDYFKKINDANGHDAGDAALRAVADMFRASLREDDLAGRWGGEEFLLMLPHTSLETGLAVAERLRATVESTPVSFNQLSIPVTMTVGVAELQQGEAVDETIKRADRALYRGKKDGRNRVVVAD